ncbi:MAG TPA: diguanylate cyclase [Lamprocystis sp. (in: g-proteobacteria)]|nr:diguanylate cyclase [Lamprocystis sp. (in: g-proteobacteria)]
MNDPDRPSRALVVDDDSVLRTALQQFIARLGFEVQGAENGQRALELFKTQGYDIVLLDAAMPIMNGFTACEAIRELPEGRHVPIIMITIYEDEDSVDRAFASGATEYVTKPIHWAVLRNRVRQLVEAAEAERRLRQDYAFFQSLVDAIPDATLVCDRAGVVRWINENAGRFPLVTAVVDEPLRLAPGVHEPGTEETDPQAVVARIRTQIATTDTHLDLLLHRADPAEGEHYAAVHARALRGGDGTNFGLILRLQDVTARELEGRRLRGQITWYGELANHDSLTELANRRLFEDLLSKAVAAAGPTGERLAVMFLDLDGFKGVNDTHGHAAGDEVLREVAVRLQGVVRRPDTVARLGGDEFAILLRDINGAPGVINLGERLLAAVCEPITLAAGEACVGASIGVSLFPEHGPDEAALLRYADEAMYAVKTGGKRGVALATVVSSIPE